MSTLPQAKQHPQLHAGLCHGARAQSWAAPLATDALIPVAVSAQRYQGF